MLFHTYDSSTSVMDAQVDSDIVLPLLSCGEAVEQKLVVRLDLKSSNEAMVSLVSVVAKAGGRVMQSTSKVMVTDDKSTSVLPKQWTTSSIMKIM